MGNGNKHFDFIPITSIFISLFLCRIHKLYTFHDQLKMLKLQLHTARSVPQHGVRQYHSHIKFPTRPSSDNYKQLLVLMSFHHHTSSVNPYPTVFPYGNGMVLHFYQQQESSTTKTVHRVINKGLKAYV